MMDSDMKKCGDGMTSKALEHVLYQTGDKDCPKVIQDCNGEVVLFLCRVCDGAEASLPTHCPGMWMTPEQAQGVVDGLLDYKNGSWLSLKEKQGQCPCDHEGYAACLDCQGHIQP